MLKNILISLAFLIGADKAFAAADGWINLFVTETQTQAGVRYDYILQNKSSLPVTAIEIGRKEVCSGAPGLDGKLFGANPQIPAPSGFKGSVRLSDENHSLVRWDGSSANPRLSGFSVTVQSPNAALRSGKACVYRADAKVWRYQTPILQDSVVPQLSLTLSPTQLESDTLFHTITAKLVSSDDQDTAPAISLVSIKSDRADFDFTKEIKDAQLGTDDRSFQVIADKLGSYIVQYQVMDAAGNVGFATQTIKIIQGPDKVAPTLTVALSPTSIQANNALVAVNAAITVKDNVDKAPTVRLVSITCDAADFNAANDVKNAVYNSDDRSFSLMAKRTSNKDRTYKITYEAKDASGNKATVSQNVTITASQPVSLLQQIVQVVVTILNLLLSLFR